MVSTIDLSSHGAVIPRGAGIGYACAERLLRVPHSAPPLNGSKPQDASMLGLRT
jgi:hypothetical protein